MATRNITKVLILGGTGMLGHVLFTELSRCEDLEVFATVRDRQELAQWFPDQLITKCHSNVDAVNFETITTAINKIEPHIIINCIGIVKQSPLAKDPLKSMIVNSLLPRLLSTVCRVAGIRLIQISTDCVFDGLKGNYREADVPNATDIYGMTKILGEVTDYNDITIRTSIIGHELKEKHGLIEWFLAQSHVVNGFTRAIFTGFPTIEFAKILKEVVIPNPTLQGLYHVSSEPISKYDLLGLVKDAYGKNTDIIPFDDFRQDRSLDSTAFRRLTGYTPPPWPVLVESMHRHYLTLPYYQKRRS